MYEDAEVQLLRAIALRDGSLPRLALATMYLTLHRYEEAEQVQREGVRLQPAFRERLEALADLLDDLGKRDEAVTIRSHAEKLPTRQERRAASD
jgi:uncharacterized protein HemY